MSLNCDITMHLFSASGDVIFFAVILQKAVNSRKMLS